MTERSAPSVVPQPDGALTLDESFARFCSLKRTQPIADLLGAKVLDCILVAATECETTHNRYAALAFPGAAFGIAGALEYIRNRRFLALAIGLAGAAAASPLLRARTHRTEPSKAKLLDTATLKQRRFVIAMLEFQEHLAAGRIAAFERITPHERDRQYREVHPSLFRADHALAAIVGGNRYWACARVRSSLQHQLPTTDLLFEIGSVRARAYLDGKYLVEASSESFARAKQAIMARFPNDRTLHAHLDSIEKMRALDPMKFLSPAAKAAEVAGHIDRARTQTLLAEGLLDYFENRMRQVEVEGLA